MPGKIEDYALIGDMRTPVTLRGQDMHTVGRFTVKNRQRDHWKKLADQIHAKICRKDVDSERGCFVQAYGSQSLDSALGLLHEIGAIENPPPQQRHQKPAASKARRKVS